MDTGRNDPLDQKFDTKPLVHWITIIEEVVTKFRPKIVFTHFAHDLNRDHQVIHEATLVACRPQSGVEEIYSYETFSSSSTYDFSPDTYIILNESDIEYKVKTMLEKYHSELKPPPHPRSVEGIKTLAQYRGFQINQSWAEAFKTIRRQI